VSRDLKRVPLNFDWPIDEVWSGYLNPHADLATKCSDCELGYAKPHAALYYAQWYGTAPFDPVAYSAVPLTIDHPSLLAFAAYNVERAPEHYIRTIHKLQHVRAGERDDLGAILTKDGSTPVTRAIADEARRLFNLWKGQWQHHLIQADVDALVAADRLPDFTRRPRSAEQAAKLQDQEARGGSGCWLEEPNGHHPTATEVNAWSIGGGLGHDAINQGVCIEARCAREGVPYRCPTCGGSAEVWPSPEAKRLRDAWEPTEPPAGDGYQLWEDVSEGSPISPVFATLDALCTWAAENATTFGDFRASAAEWKKMLDGGVVLHQEGNMVFA
jgi:hypothetical protein